MNRRAFLQRLGLSAAAVALSPVLDLAPIEAAPSVMASSQDAYVTWYLKKVYGPVIADAVKSTYPLKAYFDA